MKARFTYIAIIFILCSSILNAQGGSNYSNFGIGELHQGIGAAYDAMGGTAIAIPFNGAITNKNPAQWAFLKTTRIQAGYRFNQQRIESEDNVLWQNNGKIDGVLMNFCLDTQLAANVNMGFSAYSSVNFLVALPVAIEDCGIRKEGLTVYQGQGGVSQGWIGGSIKPARWLSLGVSAFGLFGNIKKSAATYLYGPNHVPTRSYLTDVFNSFGFRAGAIVEPLNGLYLGGYIERNPNLKVSRDVVFGSSFFGDSLISFTNDYDYPILFGVGVSYSIAGLMVAADYIEQDYTNFTYNTGNAEFRKFRNLSFGFARLGRFGYKTNFFDRTTYMIGGGYKQKYVVVQGMGIDEYYFSLGVSAPLTGFAKLDAAFTFGVRGTTDNGLLQEQFGRLTVSLSIGDIWFKPFRRR